MAHRPPRGPGRAAATLAPPGRLRGRHRLQSATVEDWPADAPSWPTAERGAFERYIPRGAYADGHTWSEATRAYQADLIQVQIETLRRLKYAPAGGFCVMALTDAEPDGGFGLLDFDRIPQAGLDAVVDACRPVS